VQCSNTICLFYWSSLGLLLVLVEPFVSCSTCLLHWPCCKVLFIEQIMMTTMMMMYYVQCLNGVAFAFLMEIEKSVRIVYTFSSIILNMFNIERKLEKKYFVRDRLRSKNLICWAYYSTVQCYTGVADQSGLHAKLGLFDIPYTPRVPARFVLVVK